MGGARVRQARGQRSGLVGEAARVVMFRAMPVDVAAHITGTVWKIQVKVGEHVEEEQPVVILESMKMEMPVESPAAGRVATIAVSEGQAVEEGEVLLTIE
jgi:acetyl-CoA carboxylase biotin carboxyl carrier protein